MLSTDRELHPHQLTNTKGVNMKLQLLLVVAALVPSLSEGRVFSKCELKTIFQTAITLPGKHQKLKEEVLAAIICQLNATSGLNSNLVTVKGIRESSTTAQPSTFAPTGNPIEPVNQTTNPATNTTKTTIAPTTTLTTTTPTTTPTNVTAAGVTTAGLASPSSSTLSGIRRRKRSSSRKSEKKGKNSKSSDESVFDVEWECDMQEIQEDDNGMRKHKKGSSESSEEDQETTDWSLGKYGIFQLTDSHFCDSGYRRSRNVCHTDCSAFTDDDISDDIECVLHSRYLGCFVKRIPRFCLDQAKTYFNDCS